MRLADCSAPSAPLVVALVVGAVALPSAARAAAGAPVVGRLTWFGQSCFLLETAAGTRVLMDPFGKGTGYPLPAGLRADVVTISHEHPDHNNWRMSPASPTSSTGSPPTRRAGPGSTSGSATSRSVRSASTTTTSAGRARGLDTVFIFEVGGLRIAHLGDLGHTLDDDQLEAIGSVDVLLVPVGGATTLDAYQATRVIDQLHPRLMVVPDALQDRTALEIFLERKANVRREAGPTVVLTSVKARPATEIVVLPDR